MQAYTIYSLPYPDLFFRSKGSRVLLPYVMDIDLICRQTNYTVEEATLKLAEFKEPMKVIEDYMGIRPNPPIPPKPYTLINEFMNLKGR